jgi:regulator of protease activity HflC (stomatin/prohibitin superfamily)
MQDLKQKLADQGLVGTLTIRETGQKIPLRFARGETKKLCKLELGPTSADVELRLVEIPDAKPDQANLTLTLWSGEPAVIESESTHEEQSAKVNDAAQAEVEAKAKADAETKAKAEADAAEAAEAARLTKEAEEKAAEERAAEEKAVESKSKSSIPTETSSSSSQSVAPSRKGGR